MLKRKVMPGGYEDSSGDENGVDGVLMRPKLAPYAPPRLIAASRSGSVAFQLPGSSGSLTRVSSNRSMSVPNNVWSARNTPDLQTVSGIVSVSRDSAVKPSSTVTSTVPNDSTKPGLKLPGTFTANNVRSSLVLERQINELTGTLEEFKRTSEEQQKATDKTLTLILETIKRLEYASTTTASETPSSRPSSPLALFDSKPLLSNPPASPELIATISKVVSEARSRVGKKKGGADDNSCKEHARNTFYRMLGITAARDVRPYFEDEYGKPDTLPSQFIDPDTGYCQPYPHWKSSLTKQPAWVPTYILRFRSTVPNDRSELSEVLRNLSDEGIVTLLNDGPFKSATTAWRDAKKSDVEIEAMRSNSRRYQRSDRKAAVRAAHIKTIPSLQGPQWEYLSHPGYMSQDESDAEGTHNTMRPEHRAQWENNLYDAILAAEREKARSKPGLCPRLPRRNLQSLKCPLPHLERGTGSGKFTIRIASCGISKAWRQNHPDEFRKHSHLINMKETSKPDITSFLEQHPMSIISSDGNSVHESESEDAAVKFEEGGSGEGNMNVAVGADGNETNQLGAWGILDYDGDEESGAVLEMDMNMYGATSTGGGLEALEPTDGLDVGKTVHIPIDPQLVVEDTQDNSGQPGSRVKPGASRVLSSSPPAAADILPAFSDDNIHAYSHVSEMPPPPLPDPNSNAIASQEANNNVSPAKGKAKRARVNKVGSVVTSAGETEGGEGLPSGATAPKRRGRPPGSKNKKPKVA